MGEFYMGVHASLVTNTKEFIKFLMNERQTPLLMTLLTA
jgi:hypothetical protein